MKYMIKKGEWCFFEFKLCQVMEIENDSIKEVSDGFFRTSGSDLSDRCFPLDMKIKQISDNVNYWREKFHELKNNSLNHPDLNRELVKRWIELCENKNNDEKLKKLYEELNNFSNSVIRKVNDLNFENVEGVNLFK